MFKITSTQRYSSSTMGSMLQRTNRAAKQRRGTAHAQKLKFQSARSWSNCGAKRAMKSLLLFLLLQSCDRTTVYRILVRCTAQVSKIRTSSMAYSRLPLALFSQVLAFHLRGKYDGKFDTFLVSFIPRSVSGSHCLRLLVSP